MHLPASATRAFSTIAKENKLFMAINDTMTSTDRVDSSGLTRSLVFLSLITRIFIMPVSGLGSSTWGSEKDEKNSTVGPNKRFRFLAVIEIHYLFSFRFRRSRAESRRRGHGVEQEQEDELEAHWRGQAVWK